MLEISSQPCDGTTVVLGANPTNTKPSETITFGDDSVKEVYNAIAEQMTKNETQNVTEINMTNPYDLTLTYDNRITFRFGNMNGMSYKMAFGLEMLRQMETSGEITEETVGSIDLSVVPEKNKAFYEEDRTAASATPGTRVMPQAARTAQTAPQTATGRTAILPIPRVIPTASRTPQQTTAVTTRATPKTCRIWKRFPVFHKFFG